MLVMCSYHNSLRRLLGSTCRSLTGLVRVLLSLADVRSEEISQRQFDALLVSSDWPKVGVVVEPYTASFSPYCCGLIADQVGRVTSELTSVTEVCVVVLCCAELPSLSVL